MSVGFALASGVGSARMGVNAKGSVVMFVVGSLGSMLEVAAHSYVASLSQELAPKSVTSGQLFGRIWPRRYLGTKLCVADPLHNGIHSYALAVIHRRYSSSQLLHTF